jgi:hypothetical protein
MAVKFYGGNAIDAQKPTVTSPATRPDASPGKGGQPTGLSKHMAEPAGNFAFSHGGGAPSVAVESADPNEPRVGETNLHTGSSLQPTVPKNVYMPNKKPIYGVA